MQLNKRQKIDIDNHNLWSYLAIEIVYYILVDLAGLNYLNRDCYRWSKRNVNYKTYKAYKLGNSQIIMITKSAVSFEGFIGNDKYVKKRKNSAKVNYPFSNFITYIRESGIRDNQLVCFAELSVPTKLFAYTGFTIFKEYDKSWNFGNKDARPTPIEFDVLDGVDIITYHSFGTKRNRYVIKNQNQLGNILSESKQDHYRHMIYNAALKLLENEAEYWLEKMDQKRIKAKVKRHSKSVGQDHLEMKIESAALTAQLHINYEVSFSEFTNVSVIDYPKGQLEMLSKQNSFIEKAKELRENLFKTRAIVQAIMIANKALIDKGEKINFALLSKKTLQEFKAVYIRFASMYVVTYHMHREGIFIMDEKLRSTEIRFRLSLLEVVRMMRKILNAIILFRSDGVLLGYQQL